MTAAKDETLPEPDGWIDDGVKIDGGGFRFRRQAPDFTTTIACSTEPLYTAATLRQAVKRANYALLMRLHEENKHKHNFFHCAAVKLMEESQ